jgi:autotransporter-associated beta strand protein
VATSTLLNLSSATPITVSNDSTGTVSTISGTALNLTSATGATINVTGLSLNDLNISAPITSVGTITKTGAGSLIINNANAASLTWNLTGGTIFVNNATSLGTNSSAGALSLSGTIGLASSATSNVAIALPTIFTATGTVLSLGHQHPNNNVTLSGAMNLNGMAPTISVPWAISSNTITGQITGTGGFTKAGAGILTLTPGTASTFTGPVTVSGGLLVEGNANAFGGAGNNGADFTVGTGAELNMNALALSIGSLAGGGIVTDSSTAQALTIGSGSNATNATFSGTLTAATQANLSLVKVGTNNQTLSGTSYYTGVYTVSGVNLYLKNGST